MSGGPDGALLPDGRLRLGHGPIDLVIEAFGEADEVEAAYAQAWARFSGILDELVAELPVLRAPVGSGFPPVQGSAARRMAAAVWPHRQLFVTPMAAVAGAVADEVMAALTAGRTLTRAYVNNGGDVALHLAPGHEIALGVAARVDAPGLAAIATVGADAPVRGIATSGWRGRSLSLGIADAVTVLAETAAAADAAATLIANAVDVDHPAVRRQPACDVDPDTDLADLPVTVAVARLPDAATGKALAAGADLAETMGRSGLIAGALLVLQAQSRLVGARERGLAHRFTAPPSRACPPEPIRARIRPRSG